MGCQGLFIALGMLFEARCTFKVCWVDPAAQQGVLGWCHHEISKFVLLHFLVPNLDVHLEVFPDSDWGDLGILGNIWMSSFQKAKEIKIPTVESKVMTSGSVLMRFSRFAQYLNWFNFDFDPWIVVGIRILLSSQWNWS